MMRTTGLRVLAVLLLTTLACAQPGEDRGIPNGSFEQVDSATRQPVGWTFEIGKGARPGVEEGTRGSVGVDETVRHGGRNSVKLSQQSKQGPWIYTVIVSQPVPVAPETTYDLSFFVNGQGVSNCSGGVDFGSGGQYREYLPAGTFDWQPMTITFATPPGEKEVRVHFVTDDPTEALWVDDVSLTVSAKPRTGLAERQYPRDFPGMFPRPSGEVARRLVVCDTYKLSDEEIRPLAALQGIVNRTSPRIYLIMKTTDPPHIDEKWLAYMKDKGYTGEEERIADPVEIIRRFRSEVTGLIVIDPDLPGSISASWMLAGLKNALPVMPEMAKTLTEKVGLPVVMDLRGKWKRNVDAYRYIYENHWNEMCHHALGFTHPPMPRFGTQDFMVAFKVFQFWFSNPMDKEKGGDPKAELEFAHEILANTPGAIPVFGWVAAHKERGPTEAMWIQLISEYGKFCPNTDCQTNYTVHSAVRLKPEDAVFKQKSHAAPRNTKLEADKVYITFSIMDCDGIGCWENWWQRIFADPMRGAVPIGYGNALSLIDVAPLIQRWYYENMTPNEEFYALEYFNEPVFANRFRKEDRERIWERWIQYVDERCRLLDLDGLELIWSGIRRPNLPKNGVLERYTRGVKGLSYIMAEISRDTRAEMPTDDCTYLLDGVVVSHTANNFRIWGAEENLADRKMEDENARMLENLKKIAPVKRPAFINIAGYCWGYRATWFMDLMKQLPADYVVVRPDELARLYRDYQKRQAASGQGALN
jgi:hypothetical protein